jgi:MFS family permease
LANSVALKSGQAPHPNHLPEYGARGPGAARLVRVYVIESLGSVASSLLTVGIFYYTTNRYGWTLKANFELSAGQGLFYVFGALAAHPITARFGSRKPLAAVMILTAILALIAALVTSPEVVVAALLVITFLTTICWPILESLITSGDVPPPQMSRRIAIYNLTWAAIGGVMVAISGSIIEHWPKGLFLLSSGACAVAAVVALWGKLEPSASDPHQARPEPEPQLERQRVLALWLARMSVPSMYVVSYALSAMLPTLSIMQQFRPAVQTLLGSAWLITRWFVFLLLGSSSFWHTRPRLLLGAAAAMLVAILAITLRPSELFALGDARFDLAAMLAGQVLLGIATGLIYTSSLYFGMVLSEGSTEHGGYHEALIGLGMILGPGAGAITQSLWPGDQRAAVTAVASILAIGICFASVISLRLRRRQQQR